MNDIQDEKGQCLGQKSAWNIRVTEQHFNDSVGQTKQFPPTDTANIHHISTEHSYTHRSQSCFVISTSFPHYCGY